MIFRIYAIRDCYITNDYRDDGVRGTGSNVGFAEELAVFKRAGISGTIGDRATGSLGRSLISFDLTQLGELTASGLFPSGRTQYRLRLNHKTSYETLPFGYDICVQRVSSSWDEGRGMDVELGDAGVANWVMRTSLLPWSTAGGDLLGAPSASVHLDSGYEDIDLDVTPLVETWLSGTAPNNGLMLRMDDAIESNSNYTDFYTKKFYSRQSDYVDRRPYLEVRANDFIGDDRSNMRWDRTGSLFLYNIIDGALTDLATLPVVRISDASGTLAAMTGSRVSVGVYSASLALPSASYSGSVFHDGWSSAGRSLLTGTFTFVETQVTNTISDPRQLIAVVRDLRDEYSEEEFITVPVMFKRRPTTLAVLSTASLTPRPHIVESCYYAIENDATRERVIPFGTGSLQHTRLSYDGEGNYFRMHMSCLHAGNVYRILLLVDESGRRTIIDPGARFKVI